MPRWTETQGRIVQSQVGDAVTPDGRSRFAPAVIFEYEVDGQRYISQQFSQMMAAGSRRWAQRIADKYPIGAPVKLYYDSQNPRYAVLQKGWGTAATRAIILTFVGIMGIGAAVTIALVVLLN